MLVWCSAQMEVSRTSSPWMRSIVSRTTARLIMVPLIKNSSTRQMSSVLERQCKRSKGQQPPRALPWIDWVPTPDCTSHRGGKGAAISAPLPLRSVSTLWSFLSTLSGFRESAPRAQPEPQAPPLFEIPRRKKNRWQPRS